MRPFAKLVLVVNACMLANASVGCSGPKLGAVPVSGKIICQGTPAKFGSVTFRPSGDEGRSCVASVCDGQYTAYALNSQKGLAPGAYLVAVVYSEKPLIEAPGGSGVPSQVADRYRDPRSSGLTLTVPQGGSSITFDIELKE
jgi:hypothetical protein